MSLCQFSSEQHTIAVHMLTLSSTYDNMYCACSSTQQENKEIALGTSKLNYLDPRISVAWCRKWEVPIEKIYNKTQREKFAWAIDMADEDFVF